MKKRAVSLLLIIGMIFCIISIGTSASAQDSSAAAAVGAASDTASVGKDYGLASSCKDGNILHCFNWTLSQIKAELPNIAAAGFTSVQTSPLQAHDGSTQWYWLYQPTGFTIGNELGSYDDLVALCSEAHTYGVKIIVDVVANHLAGSNSGTLANKVESVFKNNKSTYFHNKGGKTDDNNRTQITQYNIGMPDLNSEHTDIQDMAAAMVTRLKDAGVDGIRWDAAKHIALPSENCAFWSRMAQIDLYQYGEILGMPAGESGDVVNNPLMTEYAQYIGVSDTSYSGSIMAAVRDETTYKTNGFWTRRDIAADKIVYWAESHDTYANDTNDGGWTKNLDQNKVDRAFAILGAKADSQTLYLSRPFQKNKTSINIAAKGSTHFTSPEIAEVNRFHNLMVGTAENYVATTSYYAVLRDGGAVIASVKNADVDVSVTNKNGMVPAGTYVDHVSGNSFTVTATKITGHIGSSGIAVLYQEPAPTKEIMIGDTTLNETIEIDDATYIQQAQASIRTLTDEQKAAADADLDGDMTLVDVTVLQRYLAQLKLTDSRIGEYRTITL